MASQEWKKKKRSKFGVMAISLVVMMLFTAVAYKSVELKEKNESYMEKEASLEKQIEDELDRQEDLAQYEKYVQTKKYIEEVAREKLGLVYENEIIFKPDSQ